jgi:nicotinamidase-related amidase
MADREEPFELETLAAERSLLLVVDVQTRLAPSVEGHQDVFARCLALAEGARELGVPIVATEHCPEAIGSTLPLLMQVVNPSQIVAKRHFSAMDEAALPEVLGRAGRTQVVVAGMEAHVCVLQTALGIAAAGYDCRVAVDAVGSRHGEDKQVALERLRQAGIGLVTAEMVLFEWMVHADHPAFRTIISRIKSL